MNAGWVWLTDSANWSGSNGIPTRIGEHLTLTLIVLLVAAAIALPLGLFIGHTGRGAFLAVNSANAARALPTLGLLVLVYQLTNGNDIAGPIPLIVLAIPPILVNTYEGIRQVEPVIKDAASGMGMTATQVVARIELPIALPLILLGLRTAAIQVVATATVAAYINLGGLGGYIMDGIALQNYGLAVGGSVLVVVLAITVQLIFTLITRLVTPKGLRT
jgi:osmoprotectant transport system permease protein